jgi:hypothetical protein
MSFLRKDVGPTPWKARVTGLVTVFAAVGVLGGVGVAPASAATSPQVATAALKPPPGTLLATLNDPGGLTGDSFGWSVAVGGNTAVVGAPGTNNYQGAVYIYAKRTSGWVHTRTLPNPLGANFYFGSSVAIDGANIVVGANSLLGGAPGAAYVYTKRQVGGWRTRPTVTLPDPAATANDLFGSSVAIDGRTIVVGAPYYSNDVNNPLKGAAYVYTAGAKGRWHSTPAATLTDPADTAYDSFGGSVAVEGDVAAVGTANGDAAYLYLKGTLGWPTSPTTTETDPAPTPNDCYGCSVALDEDATLVVGAGLSNAAYIYPKTPGGWSSPTTLGEPGGGGLDFGVSVAVAGGKLVVGDDFANANGMAYEFTRGLGGWPTAALSASLADQLQTGMDRFGFSVAVDSRVTVVGAWFTYGNQNGTPPIGAAYIFSA